MKQYPSIVQQPKLVIPGVHIFEKLDGSNLRFEWNVAEGWVRSGSRSKLIDENDPVLAPAIPLFHATLAVPIEELAYSQGWDGVTVFCEYLGPNSFAGEHVPGDPMELKIIDLSPFKRGILPPEEYLRLTEGLPRAKYLGEHLWSSNLVNAVADGEFPDQTFEGVVGKVSLTNNKIMMMKAKSQTWREKVLEKYGMKEGGKILDS